MRSAPKGERMNICFLGRMNVGKSTLFNNLIGQEVAIVSDEPGTTTDPVAKRFELIPVGPVTIYDTAGYNDDSTIGKKRIKSSLKIINKSDLSIVVLDHEGISDIDVYYIDMLFKLEIPHIIIWNKSDINRINKSTMEFLKERDIDLVYCSKEDTNFDILKDKIRDNILKSRYKEKYLLKDLIKPNDIVVLVMPIDEAAPKGRIILPQMQVLREILDTKAIAICCTDTELVSVMKSLKKRANLIITDSQVLNEVIEKVPKDIFLTTFSILFARYKGNFEALFYGAKIINELKNDDKILIIEACAHHKTKDDIGTVKIPNWIQNYLGFSPIIVNICGSELPVDLETYKLVIFCGGCMLSRTEFVRRLNECECRGVTITNYGLIISEMNGVLDRVTKMFKQVGPI